MTASRREAFEELSVAGSRGIGLNRLAARLLGARHRRTAPARLIPTGIGTTRAPGETQLS